MRKKTVGLLVGFALMAAMGSTVYASQAGGTQGDSTTGITINQDFEKYFNYTDQQLKAEFKSKVMDTFQNEWFSDVEMLYYNGEISQDDEWMPLKNPESNTIMIRVSTRNRFGNGDGIVTDTERWISVMVRAENLWPGMTDNTTIEMLGLADNMWIWDADNCWGLDIAAINLNGKSYNFSTMDEFTTDFNREFNRELNFFKDVDHEVLKSSVEKYYSNAWEEGERSMIEYLKTRTINQKAYVCIYFYN